MAGIDCLYNDRETLHANMKRENVTDAAGHVARVIADARTLTN